MRSLILTTAIVSSLVIAGCGSDDDNASAATIEASATTPAPAATGSDLDAYCADVQAAFDGEDPGFDQFFTDHPEPTLEDWAAFLPGPIASLTSSVDNLDALDPPVDVADQHAAVVDAVTAVRDSFQVGLDAAVSGDQAAFDANGQAPGDEMEAAIATLGATCGIEE
jgi:outer membrane murein-binding lipoprotein Lpp